MSYFGIGRVWRQPVVTLLAVWARSVVRRRAARRRTRRLALAMAWVAVAVVGGCGGSGGGGGGTTPAPGCSADPGGSCTTGPGPAMNVSGIVRYQRLVLTTLGLGPALETKPARFVDVEVHAAGTSTCYGTASADATGAYSIPVSPPAGTLLEVIAWSRTDQSANVNVTVHRNVAPTIDAHCAGDVFRFASPSFPSGPDRVVDVTVPYNAGTSDRPSIGFGILDVLATVSEGIRTSTGTVPPICHAYTILGNNGTVGTSYYDTGANAITILGGAAGNLDGSDTDYFDDGVLAHEYHHFVEFTLSHSLNRGGAHGEENLEPPFAWSEGACTGFGCVARGTSLYTDSHSTDGGVLINADIENTAQTVWGTGSEQTVEEIVWDLGDSVEGRVDADGDGVAITKAGLYGALLSFNPNVDAPFLGLFLDRLKDAGQVTSGALATLAASPENQQFTYPMSGADVFPTPLSVPGGATGHLDSRVAPGVNPCRGRASSAWFVVTLAAPATITATLDVQPIVGIPNGNLDLSLLDMRGQTLRVDGRPGNLDEALTNVSLAAGRYLILVEANCVGAGNAADFALAVN